MSLGDKLSEVFIRDVVVPDGATTIMVWDCLTENDKMMLCRHLIEDGVYSTDTMHLGVLALIDLKKVVRLVDAKCLAFGGDKFPQGRNSTVNAQYWKQYLRMKYAIRVGVWLHGKQSAKDDD